MKNRMKKIISLTLTILLITALNIQSFASPVDEEWISSPVDEESISSPIIESSDIDIKIDTSEVTRFLDGIKDEEKRKILELYFFMPVTVTVSDKAGEDISKMEVPQNVRNLANLPVDNIKSEYNKMLEEKVQEIAANENVFATQEFKTYLEDNNPAMLESLPNKELDVNQTILVTSELDTEAVSSIISRKYYRELSYNSTYGTVLKASCEVEWKFDSSTNKITSLYPKTTFWHEGISPWYHYFTTWKKNTQFITTPTSGDRGFVQKGRVIGYNYGGEFLDAAVVKFNLVFSPSATNSAKILHNDIGIVPPLAIIDWGGGY